MEAIIDNQSASDRNSNLKFISVGNTADGLGIKLSKSSWDPYPFVSFVDETRVQQHDLQIGDCLLKVGEDDEIRADQRNNQIRIVDIFS
jgi:hypothetical protein